MITFSKRDDIAHVRRCRVKLHLAIKTEYLRAQRIFFFLYATAVAAFCYHFIFRPIILDWGATRDIRNMELPGDRFTSGRHHTRAILINAAPAEVWPWLRQTGQERAGFYSHEWLENLFFAEMKNTYVLRNEYQGERKSGDTVWLASRNNYRGTGFQVVALCEPERSLVMVGGEDYLRIKNGLKARGSWAFYLKPDGNRTWLIVRSSDGKIPSHNRLLRYLIFEVPHFIMEQKMLRTIKSLVEKSKQVDNNQVRG